MAVRVRLEPARRGPRGARAAHTGADCLIIDAESNYEGRYGPADRYIRRLRSKVGGDYPLGLAGFPYVDYHPSFPYSVFLGRRGAKWNVPQMYWKTIGTSVQTVYQHTYLYNLPYDRRIYPLGQTWQDPGRTGITDFRKYAREYGAGGTSWWSWQETEGREWDWVGKQIHRGIPGFHARQLFPTLANGSRGDLVVLAQELLNAWKAGVKVDGSFGGGVEKHVMRFQRNHGLAQTGVITAPTWRVLRQREPKWVFWGGHRHGKAADGSGFGVRSRAGLRDPALPRRGLIRSRRRGRCRSRCRGRSPRHPDSWRPTRTRRSPCRCARRRRRAWPGS